MRCLLIILAIFCFSQAKAGVKKEKKSESYAVSGKVVGSGEDLTGVKVMVENKEIIVYTDFEGNFTLDNLRGDKQTISFSLVAYDTKQVVVNANASEELLIKLYSK